ncbi:DNA damage-binding protein 1a [Coemansia sp. RSA 1813]|nr:DNA damage-binding protein 1a [Coemansia sp. RSA 1646]KAJ1767558.1 DNA damage-binding protein 1a [Coemansia sp. RSA 1843]KAJ2211360.1 DNA damage-binding protein 1a [Coemansia sp. RSA 487]KAJ2564707.1 DNA damage-binding protein 1a [Coemansia sp. RSA 1813]
MQYQYVVSAHKANSVTASVSGSFTAPHELNLVVAKGNRLEVHAFVTRQQLNLVGEYQLNGQISTLHFFQPSDRLTGLLLVTSEKFQFAVLSWDATEHCITTESTGEIIEITGRPSTEGKLVCIDPEARLIAMYAYQGIVHLFPMLGPLNAQPLAAWRSLLRSCYSDDVSGMNRHHQQQDRQEQRRGGLGSLGSSAPANSNVDEKWPYAMRDHTASKLLVPAYLKQVQESSMVGVSTSSVQSSSKGKGKATAHPACSSDMYPVLTRYIRELKVLDIQFLRSGAKNMPELAVLFEDANMARHVHVYRVSDDQGELRPVSSWTSAPVEGSATKLIPLPGGAVMVVGDESLTVVSDAQKQPLSISKKQAPVTAWQWIDSEKRERLLISDDEGVLSLVIVRYARTGGSLEKVHGLVVERLGDIPIATSLSYLSDGCLYIGSHFGDQMLARLHTQPLSDEQVEQSNQLTLHQTLALASDGRSDAYDPLEQPLGLGSVVTSRITPNTFVEPLEVFQNLAPVVDLHVVGIGESNSSSAATAEGGTEASLLADGNADGSIKSSAKDTKIVAGSSNYGSVITCSGERNRTSLRIVRNGVGIQNLASVNIDGLVGSWSLTVDSEQAAADSSESVMDVDKEHCRRQVLIVLGLVQRTRIIGWTEPTQRATAELEELSLPGWRLDERTVACGLTTDRKHAVQVTPTAVVLINTSSWQQAAAWVPGQIGLRAITAASIHGNQLALAVDGTTVAYLHVQESLVCVAQRKLEHSVSCIDIHPWTALDADQLQAESSFVALGMWEINDICLLCLPSLEQAPVALSLSMPGGTFSANNGPVSKSERAVEAATAAMRLGAGMESSSPSGDNLPRSILMSTLGHTPYLLVGLGDGRLHQYALHLQREQAHGPPALSVCEHKCVTLGTRPLILTPFVNHGTLSVFAASDHPSVLFANKRQAADPSTGISRLLYANVDSANIAQVASIDSTSFPESLCLVTGDGYLSIGRADPAQQLHVHSHPMPHWAAPHHLAHHQEAALYGIATIHTLDPDSLAVSTADMSLWEKEALMDSNSQQGSQIPDVRGQVVIRPPVEIGRFSLLDSQNIDCLSSVLLRPYEIPESLCVASFMCLPRPGIAASPNDDDDAEMIAADSGFAETARSLDNVFVLGTSIVMPEADDASGGRILVVQWDELLRRMRIIGCFTTHGAVYSLVPFRGMVLAAANNRLLLLGWQRRDPNVVLPVSQREIRHVGFNAVYLEDSEYELVVLCSQQTQIASLSVAVNGDFVAVGDIMSSVSVYRYEEVRVPLQPRTVGGDAQQPANTAQQQGAFEILHRRLVPVARDYAGAWTTCVAAIPPPLTLRTETLFPKYISEEAGTVASQQQQQQRPIPDYVTAFRSPKQKRYLVADAYSNLFRLAMSQRPDGAERASSSSGDQQRLYVEARWHLGDQVNVIRPGSLVMDVSDPEFPDVFRPVLVYGTLRGAVGVVANVENGRLGRILDRLQTNMAHLLPTPGVWDYEEWRGYSSDQRSSRAFGFLDGDLIEQFLDLPHEIQQLVFSGGSPLLADKQTIAQAEHARKAQYWLDYSRVEAEGEVAVLAQMAVSDIGQREDVSLEFVIRLVESMTRLH